MKRIATSTIASVMLAVLSGCATTYRTAHTDALAAVPRAESPEKDRMLIWRAWFTLEVASVSNAVARVTDIAKKAGGYVESKSDSSDRSAMCSREHGGRSKSSL